MEPLTVIAPNMATGAATDAAFDSRKHDSRQYRTTSGRSTFRVTRRGRAQVVGSWTLDETGSNGWSGAVAAVVGTDVRSFGTDAASVLEITARMFGDEIEPLLGTDTTSWASVGRSGYYGRPLTDADDRYWNPDGWADRCDVVERHVWLDVDSDHVLRGTSAPTLAPWRDRVALPLGPDRAGESSDVRVSHVWTSVDMLNDTRRAVALGATMATVERHVSAGDSPRHVRYIGHQKTARPAPKRSRNATTARTVGTDRPIADAVDVIDSMQPGDRVTLSGRYGYVVTRGTSGRYAITARATDGTQVFRKTGVRSGYGAALRLLDVERDAHTVDV